MCFKLISLLLMLLLAYKNHNRPICIHRKLIVNYADFILLILVHMDTMLIQLTNQKAVGLLRELEELHLIKVLEENILVKKPKLSDKYRGIITKEEGGKLNEHVQQMRSEWSSI